MYKNKLDYLKNLQTALRNYQEESRVIDLEFVNKIYEYSSRLDDLSDSERLQLDSFIEDNQIEISHIANIYVDNKEILYERLTWSFPMKVAIPSARIKFVKGKNNDLSSAMKPKDKIKILCKKLPEHYANAA